MIEKALCEYFRSLDGGRSEFGQITLSKRPDLSDYQCAGAFQYSRASGHADPQEVAEHAVRNVKVRGVRLEAQKGFINITLEDDELIHRMALTRPEPRNRNVIIDFGGPNLAKPMHVGHLRSLVLGDCLSRIANWLGYYVTRDIHLGDWGLQTAMVIANLPGKGRGAISGLTAEFLADLYKEAAQKYKDDEEFKAKAQTVLLGLQNRDPVITGIWQVVKDTSLRAVKDDCFRLGITFDSWLGESDAAPYIMPALMKAYMSLTFEDKGVFMQGQTPMVLRTKEGYYLYGATDLGTLLMRSTCEPEEILYVVDERQADHFKNVFLLASHFLRRAQVHPKHVGFGTVNGPDGKPYKTRSGTSPLLSEMIEEAYSAAWHRCEKPSAEKAHKISMAALKFGDLKNKRQTSYVYDIKSATASEGQTGPYLLYVVARINSLYAKATAVPQEIKLASRPRRQLAFLIGRFREVVEKTWEEKSPHLLCQYLMDIATGFNALYAQESIADDGSNLALAGAVRHALTEGLGLLGIETLDEM